MATLYIYIYTGSTGIPGPRPTIESDSRILPSTLLEPMRALALGFTNSQIRREAGQFSYWKYHLEWYYLCYLHVYWNQASCQTIYVSSWKQWVNCHHIDGNILAWVDSKWTCIKGVRSLSSESRIHLASCKTGSCEEHSTGTKPILVLHNFIKIVYEFNIGISVPEYVQLMLNFGVSLRLSFDDFSVQGPLTVRC